MRRPARCAVLVVLLAGCASQQQIHDATTDINAAFRREYESILAEKGSRSFRVSRTDAFTVLRTAMSRLGMRIEGQDAELGYLRTAAPAPAPLAADEWRQAAAADLPKMRHIAAQRVGPAGYLIGFEPAGLEILINAAVFQAGANTEISLTMRMRETVPPRSGMPRREYPPPTAVRLGLDKIWAQFEQELAVARRSK